MNTRGTHHIEQLSVSVTYETCAAGQQKPRHVSPSGFGARRPASRVIVETSETTKTRCKAKSPCQLLGPADQVAVLDAPSTIGIRSRPLPPGAVPCNPLLPKGHDHHLRIPTLALFILDKQAPADTVNCEGVGSPTSWLLGTFAARPRRRRKGTAPHSNQRTVLRGFVCSLPPQAGSSLQFSH